MLARMMNRLWRRETGSRAERRQSVRLGLCTLEQRDTPATLSVVNGLATYTSSAGLFNDVTLSYVPTRDGGIYYFSDPSDPFGDQHCGAASVNTITINTGDGDDTVTVQNLHNDTLNVNTGDDNDTVLIGASSGGTLSAVQGTINVNTGNGNVGTVAVYDQTGSLGRAYDFQSAGFTISGGPSVNLQKVLAVTVQAGTGSDSFTLPSGTKVKSVDGGGGTDTLTTPTSGAGFYVNGTNSVALFATSFKNVENLLGAPADPNIGGANGDTTFHFMPGGQMTGWVHGQGGENTLDYSALSSNVTVNLSTGQASLVAGGITNIQDATGGSGNDILVGNGGRNVLLGQDGQDILIGGAGADVLVGGGDQDVIIAGWTDVDANPVALNAIRADWTSGASLSTRYSAVLADLSGKVHDDGVVDTVVNAGDQEIDMVYVDSSQDSYQFVPLDPDLFVFI